MFPMPSFMGDEEDARKIREAPDGKLIEIRGNIDRLGGLFKCPDCKDTGVIQLFTSSVACECRLKVAEAEKPVETQLQRVRCPRCQLFAVRSAYQMPVFGTRTLWECKPCQLVFKERHCGAFRESMFRDNLCATCGHPKDKH